MFSNPRPLAALSQVFAERPVAFWQIFLTLGAIELTIGKQDTANRAPGDVGFGAAFIPDDAEDFAQLQLKELKNGRLAMMAIMGQFAQESLTGEGPIEQLLNGHFSAIGDGQGLFWYVVFSLFWLFFQPPPTHLLPQTYPSTHTHNSQSDSSAGHVTPSAHTRAAHPCRAGWPLASHGVRW